MNKINSSDSTDERRTFHRFSAKFPTKFKHLSKDYGVDVSLRDFSATGACVYTKDRFLIDDMLSMQVELPDGKEPLPINGRVRWIKEQAPSLWEVGLEFHKVQLMKMHRLVKYATEVEEPVAL